MEQHPVPRQITTFEFKLIGFMTLHQFLYLLAFLPPAFIVYKLFPIPVVNFLLALAIFGIGVAFAFIPVQDRPLDEWVKNLWKRINSPTQYTFEKHNPPFYLINNLYFVTDPHKVLAHIESKEKLAAYLSATQQQTQVDHRKKAMQSLLRKPSAQLAAQQHSPAATGAHPPAAAQPARAAATPASVQPVQQVRQPTPVSPTAVPPPTVQAPKHPVIIGTVKNNKKIAVPGILIYVKDIHGTPIRLLKTNPHGMFASFNPIPTGDYDIEVKDPNGGYFFDTMKVHIEQGKPANFEVYSKELL